MSGSIKQDKVRGTWYFVVDLPTVDGRRQVRRRGFLTKKAAADELHELVGNVKAGTHVDRQNVSVQAYLEAWLDGLPAAGRRTSTVTGYRQTLTAYVFSSTLAAMPLQAVTGADLDRLYGQMATSGRRKPSKGADGTTPLSGLSLRTVRYTHSILGKAFGDAVKQRIIPRTPAADATKVPPTKATRAPEKKVWTPEQLRTFLGGVGEHHHRHLFRVAAFTGMRRGELCGLRWGDLDLEGARLHVRQTVLSIDNKAVVDTVKSERSRRTIDLDLDTVAALRTHRAEQNAQRLLVGAGYDDNDLVFASPDGQPWAPDSVSGFFDRAVAATKLPRLTIHGLRHTHATHLLSAGVNPKVVSERLGHSSVAFTLDTYGHVMPGQQAEAAAAVAALVGR